MPKIHDVQITYCPGHWFSIAIPDHPKYQPDGLKVFGETLQEAIENLDEFLKQQRNND